MCNFWLYRRMSSKIVRTLSPKSVWDEESLLSAFAEHGINKKHYVKVMAKLYNDFTDQTITHLSQFEVPNDVSQKVLKVFKSGEFALMTSKVVRREDSSDNSTTKVSHFKRAFGHFHHSPDPFTHSFSCIYLPSFSLSSKMVSKWKPS